MPAAANRVRIIGGIWRSRVIRFASRDDLRPTPDRVRETLFNWLGQDLTGKICLDLFAGSGALGFEAASRGAVKVVMVEYDKVALRALRENARLLQADMVELRCANALEFLRLDTGRYDVVFLDPPFRLDVLPQVLQLLAPRLNDGAFVHVEAAQPQPVDGTWEIVRSGRAGAVSHQLLKWTGHET
jgi:16S rRNA (guanine(966)-N(2))-methyltransferase RsmD